MKHYLRILANSFIGRGTRRTIDITEGGKYGTVSARVHIRYCKEGGFQIYVQETSDAWKKRANDAMVIDSNAGLNWQRVYSSIISRRAKRANDRRAIDGQPGQIFPFTKEVN